MTHTTRPTLDRFTLAYIECALWSSTDNADESGGEPLDKNYTIDDIHPDTLSSIIADCTEFQAQHSHLWADGETSRSEWDINEQAGHDYWLTRNGHGAGFWDRPKHVYNDNADALTKAAHVAGAVDILVGDDGLLHI